MSKHSREIRAHKSHQSQQLQHKEEFDDNLLPDAEEIQKLSLIDPDIIQWLKTRGEKEQEFRHTAVQQRFKLTDKHNAREHFTARLGILIYFFLVAGVSYLSYDLLQHNHNTSGTIFGSAAVILALAVLISKKSGSTNQQSK